MKRILTKSLIAVAAAAGLCSIPTIASAHERDRVSIIVRETPREYCAPRRVWCEPVYEERCNKVWVEPVYRTECTTVFIEPVYRTVCERVWVEPVYEFRTRCVTDRCGRRIEVRERVCVREGGWTSVEKRVEVSCGRYEKVERPVLVVAGHFEERRERVCVREGRWDGVEVGYHNRGGVAVGLGFGFGR